MIDYSAGDETFRSVLVEILLVFQEMQEILRDSSEFATARETAELASWSMYVIKEL